MAAHNAWALLLAAFGEPFPKGSILRRAGACAADHITNVIAEHGLQQARGVGEDNVILRAVPVDAWGLGNANRRRSRRSRWI